MTRIIPSYTWCHEINDHVIFQQLLDIDSMYKKFLKDLQFREMPQFLKGSYVKKVKVKFLYDPLQK